ncbi:uncharacterized protein LOC134805918 [Cydia splendana]|uniref:uncharacterized protein LOC134805918 n=1 Tax=Cydia splendana TaxID=1100963 RepID=UPI00300D42CF
MGKHKKKSRKHKRARSVSSSSTVRSSDSESARTPSPLPPQRKKSRKLDRSSKPLRINGPETVSHNNTPTLYNIIPEFDPLKDDINAWLRVIQSYASTFSWSDEITRYQALNKLKGSAKVWYDSLLRTDHQWPSWKWSDWHNRLSVSFQIQRNMFELLKEIIERKPAENQSLYEFYFDQKCKIDRLRLNFSDQDVISIVLGNIGDGNIESNTFNSCDQFASYLHSRTYKAKKQTSVSLPKANHVQSPVVNTSSNASVATTTSRAVASGSVGSVSNENNSQARKTIKCFLCGGNHKRMHCDIKCEFCGIRGHIESTCNRKKNVKTEQKSEKPEVKFVSSSNSRNKFVKKVVLNNVLVHDAFIDPGSSCSIISQSLVTKHCLQTAELPSPVTLNGYKEHSSKIVTTVLKANLKLDSVEVNNVEFYIMDDLVGCDILIGRNVTERPDLMYSRIGEVLKFDYVKTLNEFCNSIGETELDANSNHAELMTLFRKYSDCIARNVKELGKANNHEMVINVTDPRPIQCRPFRSSPSDRQVIRDMVDELLANDIVRHSDSP